MKKLLKKWKKSLIADQIKKLNKEATKN